jgi:hypothetical protein
MAEAAHEYHTGDQDISEQISTFHLVNFLLKWGSLAIAVVVTTATLWFCTQAGFFTGLIVAFVIAGLGIYFLRSKPEAEH